MDSVSVVMPLYNKAPHVERAIRSVLEQTYPHFELIVVDDGSTDAGASVVESIGDHRIRLIRQTNHGVSAARNTGISAANYPWIAFLDADDEWLPEFLDAVLLVKRRFPAAKMAGSAYLLVDEHGVTKVPRFYGVPKESGVIQSWFRAAIKRSPTWSSAVLVDKTVFERLGGFPVELRRGEDSFMWCKIALQHEVLFVNRPLAVRYWNTVNRPSQSLGLYDFPLFEYMKERGITPRAKDAYFVEEFVYQKLLQNAKRAIIMGNLQQAQEFILKARKTKEFRARYLKLQLLVMVPNGILRSTIKGWRGIRNRA